MGFYFRRLERFHAGRVPARGPMLFTSNHPNSLTDSFVIGLSVPRKVNFIATVQLLRCAPFRWLLTRCGVIPVNRFKDDPRAMRSVMDTFEACFRVLERGEAVAIFPEGITHDDPQLKGIKTGAARMALELEQRHHGRLGLQIVPVGLNFAAKETYRSDVLVNFGEPIRVAEYLADYTARRKECISRLTAEIERRIQSLILHIPHLEHARVVEGVKRLYLERLRLGNTIVHEPVSPRAETLLLTQTIAAAVEHVYATQPGRAAAFAAKLGAYEGWLRRLRIADDDLAHFPDKQKLVGRSLLWTVLALVGAPVALYGWLHRLLPVLLVRWVVRCIEPGRRAVATSTATVLAGIVAFGVCYGLFIALVQAWFGWPASLWYALSLPLAGLVAHYYLRTVRRLIAGVRNTIVLLRAPLASKRLLALRAELIAEIEAARPEIRRHLAGPETPPATP